MGAVIFALSSEIAVDTTKSSKIENKKKTKKTKFDMEAFLSHSKHYKTQALRN